MQLIPVTEQHLSLIEKWHADKRIYNFLNNGEPIDVALDLNSFPESGPAYARIIEHGGSPVGLATFFSKDEYVVNPVYFLDPASQGQGLGKQMVQTVLDFLAGRGV
ncbi:GNAT family N-acetyltransferase, partial [Candidatus Dojkabacteria bacterium]|nr:GNAT family N-acetyltransferase [Candidatus Dojkabacteria bacterium]